MSPDKLPFNMFDVTVLAVLVLGIWRGRRRGMSEETLPLVRWLVALFGAAAAYEPVGRFLESVTVFGPLFCYIVAYLAIILAVFTCFSLIKHFVGGKLIGSDIFGRGEYYLGMAGGMVHFACVLLVGLAVLNARLFTPEEVRAMQNFQRDVYGSEFFPTLYTLQDAVFVRSGSGPWIRRYAEGLLIKPTPPESKPLPRPKDDWVGFATSR
jgi:uncharacterized membrane protein required for colicin V production